MFIHQPDLVRHSSGAMVPVLLCRLRVTGIKTCTTLRTNIALNQFESDVEIVHLGRCFDT